MTELAFRESDGIEVVLRWNRISGELTVSVRDRVTGESFDVRADRHDALDVFNHPYAYASVWSRPGRLVAVAPVRLR
jgi:hypothetical protein